MTQAREPDDRNRKIDIILKYISEEKGFTVY
jgi:hypothetical protein